MMCGKPCPSDIVEALLLATDRPLSAERIARVVPRLDPGGVRTIIDQLNRSYEESGRSFRVRMVAEGYRLYTLPEYESYVEALAVTTREARLSQAALETLAVVAYRQPVSRSDVEYVRGCDCDGVIRTLLTRKLIAIKGRSDAPGRPLLYATTDRFLEYFGLAQLCDLPDWSEIAALVGDPAPRTLLKMVRPGEGPATEREEETASGPALAPEVEPEPHMVGAETESGAEEAALASVALPPGDEA
jgi:segregation and condensation protein B